MDHHPPPPPPPPPHSAATSASIPLSYTSDHLDSAPSSPCSSSAAAVDEDRLPSKLRLMCSYRGHIIPRPHDKSLCYVGGETRIVVVDRRSSLADLSARLSATLLHGRPFVLKYQLPSEDLDSLISVTDDDDLANMIEEYDRATCPASSPLKPSRLRLFLFFSKPETATSMGTLLDDAKSETWFVDALNNAGILPRGLSDSATAMDCLLDLGDGSANRDTPSNDLKAQLLEEGGNHDAKLVKVVQDVQFTMPDSPMVENTNSSYESSSSSPSMSNLPPIRVRLDHKAGTEDQFAQMSVAASHFNRHEDGFGVHSTPPPPIPSALHMAANASASNQVAASAAESLSVSNRTVSDGERSDQGAPRIAFRKPPLPLLPVQVHSIQHKASSSVYNLPSPDSVASDSSIASASSLSRPMHYEDQSHVGTKDQRSGTLSPTPASDFADVQVSHLPESTYVLPTPLDHHQPVLQPQPSQQQHHFVQVSATHYMPHHPGASSNPSPSPSTSPSPVLVSPYYSVYPTQSQPQQLHHPLYVLPVQSNVAADASMMAPSHPLPTPSPALVSSAGGYKDPAPPIYPAKAVAQVSPEIAASMYNSYMTSASPLFQVPQGQQYQQQPVGLSQLNNPSQAAAAANYTLDYAYSAHDQAFYAQHHAPVFPPPQYQTMAVAAATMPVPDTTHQPATTDVSKQ